MQKKNKYRGSVQGGVGMGVGSRVLGCEPRIKGTQTLSSYLKILKIKNEEKKSHWRDLNPGPLI